MEHHTHTHTHTRTHNFFNRHTAFAILILILGCFFGGYFVGRHSMDIDELSSSRVIINN